MNKVKQEVTYLYEKYSMEFVVNKHLIVGVKANKTSAWIFSRIRTKLIFELLTRLRNKMKTSTFIIFTLCLYISVVVARPEPGHSSESHSHERFDGYGHSHEDFSGEDLFNRRGGNSVL